MIGRTMGNEKEIEILNFLAEYFKTLNEEIETLSSLKDDSKYDNLSARELLEYQQNLSVLFGKREAFNEITKKVLEVLQLRLSV